MARMQTQDFQLWTRRISELCLSSELCCSHPHLPSKAQEARLAWGSRRHCSHCQLNRKSSRAEAERFQNRVTLKPCCPGHGPRVRTCGYITGRLLKASGKMEDRASQALAWRVGCSEFCKARGKGPFNIAVQNFTTWNGGTVRTTAQHPQSTH